MGTNPISLIGLQTQSLANLNTQQTNLATLNEQLASGQLYDNLTQYDPTTAKNLMDFQNAVTQNQAYISGMQTVTNRLNLYNQTMGDMENIVGQAQTLASGNQTLDPTKVTELQAEAQDFLQQVTDDLNQQIGGRYIYAGTRYNTPPVSDLATLTTAPSIPFNPTTSPTLPDYDSQYQAITVNGTPSGNFQVGNTTVAWSDIEAGSVTSVNVNGNATPVTITGLTAASTPAEIASNLQSVITQLSASGSGIDDFSGLSASVSGATVSLQASSVGQNNSVTVNSTPTGNFQVGNSDLSWSQVVSGNVTSVTVNGVSTPVTVTGLTTPATTPNEIASNLQSALTQIGTQLAGFSDLTASVSGATVSIYSTPDAPSVIPDNGAVSTSEIGWTIGTAGTAIKPDASGASGEISWSGGTDGTSSQTLSSSAGAFTKDSVAIDNSSSITYGVTSNDPVIQKLVAGLQFINAATQPGVSATNYNTYMQQATNLLSTALTGLQSLNTNVASNLNILNNQTSLQNSDITNLQNQLTNLQSVNLTQVGTEIDSLQTQLQASYSATATLEQLSILKYL